MRDKRSLREEVLKEEDRLAREGNSLRAGAWSEKDPVRTGALREEERAGGKRRI